MNVDSIDKASVCRRRKGKQEEGQKERLAENRKAGSRRAGRKERRRGWQKGDRLKGMA